MADPNIDWSQYEIVGADPAPMASPTPTVFNADSLQWEKNNVPIPTVQNAPPIDWSKYEIVGQAPPPLLGTDNPTPLQQSGRLAAGGFTRLLNALTFNTGDEALAGINAGIDAGENALGLGGAPFSDAYNQRLEQTRNYAKAFQQASPGGALAIDLAPTYFLPIKSKVGSVAGIGGKTAQAMKEGAVLGSAYGFGGGEGNLKNRLLSSVEGGATGAAVGGALTGTVAIGKELPARLRNSGESLDRTSIGTRYGDYLKSANPGAIGDPTKDLQFSPDLLHELPENGDFQTHTRAAIDDLLRRGELGTSRDPRALWARGTQNARKLSSAIDSTIKQYEESGGASVFPEFPTALDYLQKGKVPADKVERFLTELGNLESAIRTEGKGSLSYLQQQKIAKGLEWDPNDSARNGFIRAVYTDLKNSIESVVPEVGPLNAELQKYKIVQPILNRGMAQKESASFLKKVGTLGFTTGGIGGPTYIGAHFGGPVGAVVGATTGLTGRYLYSNAGHAATAKALNKLGNSSAVGALSKIASKVDQALLSRVGSDLASEGAAPLAPQSAGGKTQGSKSSPLLQKGHKDLSYNNSAPGSASTQAPIYNKAQLSGLISRQHPLVQAVISAESSGNASAIGPAIPGRKERAVGLMQVLPSTAKDYGYSEADLKNPQKNIEAGTKILSAFNTKYKDARLALAAYNFGPGAVDRARQQALRQGKAPTYDGIRPLLPSVTRQYVADVLGDYKKLLERTA